jgi:transcriptional regulator with XRE-family HTH domain
MTQPLETVADEREPLSQRAARRLRGALAENRISQTAFARAMHLPQQTLSRKVNGQTPFTIDELEHVAEILGLQLDAVLGLGDHADRVIGRCSIRVDERPAAPGGGQAFLPLDEAGAPSGTRTPNPLIPSQPLRGVVVPFKGVRLPEGIPAKDALTPCVPPLGLDTSASSTSRPPDGHPVRAGARASPVLPSAV